MYVRAHAAGMSGRESGSGWRQKRRAAAALDYADNVVDSNVDTVVINVDNNVVNNVDNKA